MAVEIVYLDSGSEMPEVDQWMLIELYHDGGFLASGAGQTEEGRSVYYSERAADLSSVLEAAQRWCAKHGVARIHVQIAT